MTELRQQREKVGVSQQELADESGYSLKTIQRWEAGLKPPRKAVFDSLERIATRNSPARAAGGNEFTFIDLFAGIGGIRRAFDDIGGHCVFTSELDKYARKTYSRMFGEEEDDIAGNIIDIPSANIPAHDVLLAGFPCQPFSIAGVSKKNSLGRPHGFECDTQGTLFFEVERILEYHRPRAFLLENVKNLVSHDGGRTYRTIMQVLRKKLNYHVFDKVIDARPFVPQHRERIIIVGFRDECHFDWNDLSLPPETEWPKLRNILHPEDGSEEADPDYTDECGRVHDRYTLSSHLWNYLQQYAKKHKAKGNGFGFGLFGPDDVARTLSARYYKDGSEILIKRSGNPRRLTPRECARLMGFDTPDKRMPIPVSDTQAYKQFGNSVAVPVIRAVARLMKPNIVNAEAQLTLPLKSA